MRRSIDIIDVRRIAIVDLGRIAIVDLGRIGIVDIRSAGHVGCGRFSTDNRRSERRRSRRGTDHRCRRTARYRSSVHRGAASGGGRRADRGGVERRRRARTATDRNRSRRQPPGQHATERLPDHHERGLPGAARPHVGQRSGRHLVGQLQRHRADPCSRTGPRRHRRPIAPNRDRRRPHQQPRLDRAARSDHPRLRHYGTVDVDASLLTLPLVGFVDADDKRMVTTTDAIMDELAVGPHGFLLRYRSDDSDDSSSSPSEGVFLLCSFWLVEVLALQGRLDEARALFDALAGVANDVGLFSEEATPDGNELLGNFPQAFTHLGLIAAEKRLRDATR